MDRLPGTPGRSRPARRDGSAAGAIRPSPRRARRRDGLSLRSHTPNKWARNGKREAEAARAATCSLAVGTRQRVWRHASFEFRLPGFIQPGLPWAVALHAALLLDDLKSAAHFLQQVLEPGQEERLLRIDDNVHRNVGLWAAQANGFPQAAFHPVSHYSTSQGAAYGKAHSQAFPSRSRLVKDSQVTGEQTPSFFIH